MGRIFEKRKDRMFARWAKNARAFTKLGKELAIAVRLGGEHPDTNPRLRGAIAMARSLNMPKDRIEAAIHRASSKDAGDLQEVTYEGYGPHGIAIFVETATDNSTRTVANVRSIFTRWGGSLGTTGSLSYIFERKGVFTIDAPSGDLEEFELELMDHGLEDMFESEDGLLIYCNFSEFGAMQKILENTKVEIKTAAPQRITTTQLKLNAEQEAEVQKLIDALEEDEDVQHVYSTLG